MLRERIKTHAQFTAEKATMLPTIHSADAGLVHHKRSPAKKPLSMRLTSELEAWLDQQRGELLSRSAIVRVVLQGAMEQRVREERQ